MTEIDEETKAKIINKWITEELTKWEQKRKRNPVMSIIDIQPLPDSALPIYDRDIEVVPIILDPEDDNGEDS